MLNSLKTIFKLKRNSKPNIDLSSNRFFSKNVFLKTDLFVPHKAEPLFIEPVRNKTGAPLDIEILGSGFFGFKKPDGLMVYSRQSSLKRSSSGKVQDTLGNLIFPEVIIPQKAQSLQISSRGVVRVLFKSKGTPQRVGQIEIFYFKNPAELKSVKNGFFVPCPESGEAQQELPATGKMGLLAQGYLESSEIDFKEEFFNLID